MVAILTVTPTTIAATVTQYINIGTHNTAMVAIAYDSTNSYVYVAFYQLDAQSNTPIILIFLNPTLALVKALALNWGSASISTQMTNTMFYNPLDGYVYFSGFTDHIQSATVLPQ